MSEEEEGTKQVSPDNFGEHSLKGLKETITTVREFEFAEPLRRCKIRKLFKSLSGFRRQKSIGRIKKYRRECKECAALARREYVRNNPEKAKAARERWLTTYPERQKTSERRWYENNKDHRREYTFLSITDKRFKSGYCGKTWKYLKMCLHLIPKKQKWLA